MNYLIAAFATSWIVYFAYLLYLNSKLNHLKKRAQTISEITQKDS